MVPLNKSGLVRAKPGNFTLKSLNRCFSNYYQVRTWRVFAETVTYKLNDLRMPLYVLMAIDGNGESEIVCLWIVQSEDNNN